MKMDPNPEILEMISQRLDEDVDKTSKDMERMVERGSVLCMEKEGRKVYSPAPYMVGLYENLVKLMDEEVAGLLEQYHKEVYFKHFADNIPPLTKYIPVGDAKNDINIKNARSG